MPSTAVSDAESVVAKMMSDRNRIFILKFFIILYYIENQSNAKIIKLENYLLFLFFCELGFCSTSCSLSNAFHAYDGYEGSFTGWLIPYVEPSYKLTIKDDDYPHKTGNYYVIATEVEFGSKGGSKKVTIRRRI